MCEGNYSSLHRSAQALAALQGVYGVPPRILGKGIAASTLHGLLSRRGARMLLVNLAPEMRQMLIVLIGHSRCMAVWPTSEQRSMFRAAKVS